MTCAGRGGFAPQGPPDQVYEMGTFMHASEGEMVCTSTNVKIPYFNAPIYLENKTAVGKVDEILGPINQVYFTIKPQEGIVATSFKNGDKFYIGGDKLLPLERYTSLRWTIFNSNLTLSPDSFPSPSPLPVLLRSRSPQVAVVPVVDSVVAVVVLVAVQEVASVAVAVAASAAVVAQGADSVVTAVAVEVSKAVVALVASAVAVVAAVVVAAVVATKRSSHLQAFFTHTKVQACGRKQAAASRSYEALDGLGNGSHGGIVSKRGSSSHVLRCTGLFEYREKRSKKIISTSFLASLPSASTCVTEDMIIPEERIVQGAAIAYALIG